VYFSLLTEKNVSLSRNRSYSAKRDIADGMISSFCKEIQQGNLHTSDTNPGAIYTIGAPFRKDTLQAWGGLFVQPWMFGRFALAM